MQAVSIPRVLLLLFMAAPDSVLVGPAQELVSSRVDRACRWEIATYPGA